MRSTGMQGTSKGRSNKMSKTYNKVVEKRLQKERPTLQDKAVARLTSYRTKSRTTLQRMQGKRTDSSRADGRPHTTNKTRRKSLRAKKPTTSMQSMPPSKKVSRVSRRVDAAFYNLIASGFNGARSLKRAVHNFNRLIMEYKATTPPTTNNKGGHV